jgi:hypothetical protein
MIGFIAFGALVALGALNVARKRREAVAREYIARQHAERARHEAAKAIAELEAHKLTHPAPRRGRPRKAADDGTV